MVRRVADDIIKDSIKESREDEQNLAKDNYDKLKFYDLVGESDLEYTDIQVLNLFDEDMNINYTLTVEITPDHVIDFICNKYNLAKDLLTVEEAQQFIDKVNADPKRFNDYLLDYFAQEAEEKAQEYVATDYVDGYGPKKHDVMEDKEEIRRGGTPNMKLTAVFEVYERYNAGPTKKLTANGKDKIECLKKLVDHMSIYTESEDIDDAVAEGQTFEDIIKEIEMSNGDGCDYIYSLYDDQGNIYIDNDYQEEEI